MTAGPFCAEAAGFRFGRGSILRAATLFNPFVDGCLFEAQIATQLEVRNLALFDKPVHGAQVAMEIIGNHPGGQDLIAAVAAIFPILVSSLTFHCAKRLAQASKHGTHLVRFEELRFCKQNPAPDSKPLMRSVT